MEASFLVCISLDDIRLLLMIPARRILVIMDRWLSAQLGRSCSIQEEEWVQFLLKCRHRSTDNSISFDLDLPIDVDDEYWDNPDPAQMFKQPPGRPSRMGFFIGLIKLGRVLGVALRSIVGTMCARPISNN